MSQQAQAHYRILADGGAVLGVCDCEDAGGRATARPPATMGIEGGHRTDDAHTYVFMERYKDEAATEFHRNSDHFKTLGAAMKPFMAGRPDVVRMEEVE